MYRCLVRPTTTTEIPEILTPRWIPIFLQGGDNDDATRGYRPAANEGLPSPSPSETNCRFRLSSPVPSILHQIPSSKSPRAHLHLALIHEILSLSKPFVPAVQTFPNPRSPQGARTNIGKENPYHCESICGWIRSRKGRWMVGVILTSCRRR